ncbi:hypothetical protein EXIGLDRAFT_720592, partial [Exidia glandulosa HHB12029]
VRSLHQTCCNPAAQRLHVPERTRENEGQLHRARERACSLLKRGASDVIECK